MRSGEEHAPASTRPDDEEAGGEAGRPERLGNLLDEGGLATGEALFLHVAPSPNGTAAGRRLVEVLARMNDAPLRIIDASQLPGSGQVPLAFLQRSDPDEVIYFEKVEAFDDPTLSMVLAAALGHLDVRDADDARDALSDVEAVRRLEAHLSSVVSRGLPAGHVLVQTGEVARARAFAEELARARNVPLRDASGTTLRPGDLAAALSEFQEDSVVFLGDSRRLPRGGREILTQALADGTIGLEIGKGPTARQVRLDLPPFVAVVSAADRHGLPSGLVSTFATNVDLRWTPRELSRVVDRCWGQPPLWHDADAAAELAKRAAGEPRRALYLAGRVREAHQSGARLDATTVARLADAVELEEVAGRFTEVDWLVLGLRTGASTASIAAEGTIPPAAVIASTSLPWDVEHDARSALGPLGSRFAAVAILPETTSTSEAFARWELERAPLFR